MKTQEGKVSHLEDRIDDLTLDKRKPFAILRYTEDELYPTAEAQELRDKGVEVFVMHIRRDSGKAEHL